MTEDEKYVKADIVIPKQHFKYFHFTCHKKLSSSSRIAEFNQRGKISVRQTVI